MNKHKLLNYLLPIILISTFACKDKSTSADPNNDPVSVPNDRLANEIRSVLNLAAGAEITVGDMLKLDTLDINGIPEIVNLTGLETAVNLTYLHMGRSGVTNLTPISDLKKIEYLRLNNTAVTDLSPISGMTSLTYFNINTTTGITDISPLAGNAGLQELIMRNVPFGNAGMATLLEFPVLYRLNMRSTGVTDISVLATMMANGALQNNTPAAAENGGATLDLRNNDITNYSVIQQYVGNISNLDGYPSSKE